MPGAREWIRGVINRRGQVTAVVDLAVCLGLAPAPVTARTCILIFDAEVEGNRMPVGIAIDGILDTVALGPHEIEAPPKAGLRIPVERLLGVAHLRDGFVSVLDVGRLLPLDGAAVAANRV